MDIERFLEFGAIEFARSNSPAARRTVEVMHSLKGKGCGSESQPISSEEGSCAVPDVIETLLAETPKTPILDLLSTVYRDLHWHLSKKSHSPYSQIIGPNGQVHHDEIVIGIFLLGAHCDYPNHQHRADEIYIVLAGTGEWSLNRGPYEPKVPGDIIAVPSMTVHALRTTAKPVLILWSWTGDDISYNGYRFC